MAAVKSPLNLLKFSINCEHNDDHLLSAVLLFPSFQCLTQHYIQQCLLILFEYNFFMAAGHLCAPIVIVNNVLAAEELH